MPTTPKDSVRITWDAPLVGNTRFQLYEKLEGVTRSLIENTMDRGDHIDQESGVIFHEFILVMNALDDITDWEMKNDA